MIHLHEMRAAVDAHLEEICNCTDEQIMADLPRHIRDILNHLERMHRNIAVHIETLG